MRHQIHATAIVDASAQLADDVIVGAWTQIGPHVTIDAGTSIGSHCVIEGKTKIGKNNRIFQFNSIGAEPQDKKYAGELTELIIGDGNTIREFCSINTGTSQGGGVTKVGDDNWIMAYVHLAHDVYLGSHCILANNATIAGHVQIDDWAIIGGLTGVHQHVRIGQHAMVGFSSAVAQDVLPFVRVDGNPLKVYGLNSLGLRRRGFSAPRLELLKQIYRLIYRQELTLQQAQQQIAALSVVDVDSAADIALTLAFLENSERGIVR